FPRGARLTQSAMTFAVRGSTPYVRGDRDAERRSEGSFRRPPEIRTPARDRGVSQSTARDRAPCRAAVGGGSGDPVDAGREPDQVAPCAYDLVFRDVSAAAESARLQSLRRALRVPIQLVLRRG